MSRKFSDLPQSSLNHDDFDIAYGSEKEVASGWLSKSRSKNKSRSGFKKRYFVLCLTGPSTAKLSYFSSQKAASKRTSDKFIAISGTTSVTRLDDNFLQLKSDDEVLTVQPIASSNTREAKAKQRQSTERWESILNTYITMFAVHELKTQRNKRRKSKAVRRRLSGSSSIAQPYCKGFMYKLPSGYKKLTGAWKRRYFVLIVDTLHFYTNEQPQFKDDFLGDLAVNSPEYLGSFRIQPYTQITQNLSPLSEESGCPKSITIANENNEVIILHPEAPEPTSDKCEVLQRWLDALGASVEYSREMFRQRGLQSRKSSAPMPNSAQFSLVIGHKQPKNDITGTDAAISAGMHHEYFSMALMETIGQLVSKIVETLDLKWLHQPAILFRGKPTAGGACKVGFLGDTDDMALHPDRTMEQFIQWAGKASLYACFIAPEALDWEQMMPWEHTGVDSRRLLVRDVPVELDAVDASLSSKRKKSKKKKTISSLSENSQVIVTNTNLSLVLMMRQKTRNSWQLRLEILKVVGLDPNRVPKSEVCEVECWQRSIDATGELSKKRVPEINRRKSTKAAKNMQVPEFKTANRPEKFDFIIASPNITVLNITLKSGGRKLGTTTLEPLDIMSFASPIFLNQIDRHVELRRKQVPYTMPLHTQLIADLETKSTSVLPDSFGDAIRATNQNKSVRVGNVRYTLNTELLRPSKKDPEVFEGWLIGRIEGVDVPASSPLLKADGYTTRGYICLLPGADRPQCRHMTDFATMEADSGTGGASFQWQLPETFFFWIQNAACSKLRVKFNFHTQYNRSGKDLNAYSSFPAIATINIPYAGAEVLAEDDEALFQPKSVTEVTETFIEAEKIWEDERTEQLARVFMRFDAEEPGYIPNHLLQPLIKALKVQSWDIPTTWEDADVISFVEVAQWWNDEETRQKLQRTDEYVRRFKRWSTDGELNSTGVRHLSQELGMDPERAVRDMSVDHGEFVSMPQFMDWANGQESDKEFTRPPSEEDEPALLDSLKEEDTQLSTDVKAALEALNSQLVHVRHMAAMIQQTRRDPAIDPDNVGSL